MEVLGDVSESVPGQTHAEENEDSVEPAGNSGMVTPSASEGSDRTNQNNRTNRNSDPRKSLKSQAEAAEAADGLMHWDEIENTGAPDNQRDAFAQFAAMASSMFSAPDETDN